MSTATQTRIQGVAACRLRPGEIAVDLFAGGGGASRGIELATGISPAIAINHDPHAIKMHEANHPDTIHFCQSVYHREVHPSTLIRDGVKVGVLWLSPDCRHFSRAKGSAPVSASVRALAFIGLRWAKFARPRIVVLENVPEFVTWGPLLPDGKPNKARAGETFQAFVREWKRYGYTVEWGPRIAADFGIPTTRKRLFLVARCDGEAIRPPVPTHGKLGKPLPWRTAAECIDWSDLGRSIFERKKPLAPATCRRIARGIVRYVLTSAKPFLIHMGNGEREGQAPRCQDIQQPMGTIVAQRSNAALVAAFLAKHNGGTTGQPLTDPLHTIAGNINKALVTGAVIQIGARHGRGDQALGVPMATLLTTERMAIVAAFLVQYYSTGTDTQALDEPLATIVTRARHGLVTVIIDGAEYAIVDIRMRMLKPRELARAQGFDDTYILTGTQSQQVARIGNSVPPGLAEAVLSANLDPIPPSAPRGGRKSAA